MYIRICIYTWYLNSNVFYLYLYMIHLICNVKTALVRNKIWALALLMLTLGAFFCVNFFFIYFFAKLWVNHFFVITIWKMVSWALLYRILWLVQKLQSYKTFFILIIWLFLYAETKNAYATALLNLIPMDQFI